MTINEAIDLIQRDIDHPGDVPAEVLNKAKKLGIEALKEVKRARSGYFITSASWLPGETEN
ncbi:hypothetical protein ES708_24081 [subsurface metagenome]